MAYFAAGAWWSSNGQAFSTQQAAESYEQAVAAQGQMGPTDDEFAAAMGRGGGTGAQRPLDGQRAATPQELAAFNQQAQYGNAPMARTTPVNPAIGNQAAEQAYAAQRPNIQRPDPGNFFQRAARDTLEIGSAAFNNPVLNTPTWAVTQGGQAVDRATGVNVSGYIQDPGGQALSDLGAPDLVQAAYNPTGYVTRQSVNAGTGYGMNVPQVALNGAQSIGNLQNDARNTARTVQQIPAAIGNIANRVPTLGGGNGGGGTAPPPLNAPTPNMTPQQILGMNTQAVRPSSAQQDSIINQMIGQSQQTSGYQDFNSAQYNQSRGAAMNYTSQLAGLANNNVPITGLNGGQYNQSRGLMENSYGLLNAQANNRVADIQADATQRNQSRNAVMDTANMLNANANRDISNINADTTNSLESRLAAMNSQARITAAGYQDVAQRNARTEQINPINRDIEGTEALLRGEAARGADAAAYNASTAETRNAARALTGGTNADIIQRLIAASEMPDDVSAAEALALNMQERATRNAFGDAASVGGGWRSQLTGQRQAMGRAAAQQADIAAQISALRASETQNNRIRQIEALTQAGGMSGQLSQAQLNAFGQMDARELELALGNHQMGIQALTNSGQLGLGRMGLQADIAISDANRNTAIDQGNQQNRLNAFTNAGALAAQIQGLDQNLAISDADRNAQIANWNQVNRLNSMLGAGNLQTGAMNSDTSLAQSNASLLAQVRLANQQNALNSLIAGSNVATNMNSNDLGFATNDAQIRTQRELANQQNALNALLGASNAANTTAGMDANIGMNNANNRVTVDQNNRANAIAALQNAGVLSNSVRAQDVQLSQGNQNALVSQINAAAGMSNSQFGTAMSGAIANQNTAMRQRELDNLRSQNPTEFERWLRAAGGVATLLGV